MNETHQKQFTLRKVERARKAVETWEALLVAHRNNVCLALYNHTLEYMQDWCDKRENDAGEMFPEDYFDEELTDIENWIVSHPRPDAAYEIVSKWEFRLNSEMK